jgi:tRNA threonylcarbamoyladenosine biosynthesis protein TsaB
MRVLGIETSTMLLGAAVLDKDGLLAECRFQVTRSRSERLMPMIDRVLKEAQMEPQSLEGLAISIGPGSFTGLRVGLSTAKGLAFALGLPVVGVSTLEVLAAPLAMGRCPYPICPMLDARRQEVYAGLFHADPEGGLKKIMENEAISPVKLSDQLAERDEPIAFLGTGAILYENEIRKRLGDLAIFVYPQDPYPRPSMVAALGMRRLVAGEKDDLSSLTPLYLSRFQTKLSG